MLEEDINLLDYKSKELAFLKAQIKLKEAILRKLKLYIKDMKLTLKGKK